MIQVPNEIKQLFTQDSISKNFRVHFPNGEYRDLVNADIVAESVIFTESLGSTNGLTFGVCEGSTLEFQTFFNYNIRNLKIVAGIEIDISSLGDDFIEEYGQVKDDVPFPVYYIQYGIFYVDSCKRDGSSNVRKIVAYQNNFDNERIDIVKLSELEEHKLLRTKILSSLVPATVDWKEGFTKMLCASLNTDEFVPDTGVTKTEATTFNDVMTTGTRANAALIASICQYKGIFVHNGKAYRRYYTYDLIANGLNNRNRLMISGRYSSSSTVTVRPGEDLYCLQFKRNEELISSAIENLKQAILDAGTVSLTSYYSGDYTESITESVDITNLFSSILDDLPEYVNNAFGITPYTDKSIQVSYDYSQGGLYPHIDVNIRTVLAKEKKFQSLSLFGNKDSTRAYSYTDLFYRESLTEGEPLKQYYFYPWVSDTTFQSMYLNFLSTITWQVGFQVMEVYAPNDPSTESIVRNEFNYGSTNLLDTPIFDFDNGDLKLTRYTYDDMMINLKRTSEQSYGSTYSRVTQEAVDTLNASIIEILKSECELKGGLARINRYNDIEVKYLYHDIGVYPSPDLFPSEDLYPDAHAQLVTRLLWKSIWYEDKKTNGYDRLVCYWKDTNDNEYDLSVDLVDTTSEGYNQIEYQSYDISDNYFIKTKGLLTQAQVTAIVQNLAEILKTVQYFKADIEMRGLPYVEAGDSMGVVTNDGGFFTFCMRRRLTGIHGLMDDIEAR